MVRLYNRGDIPEILHEKMERLDPILRHFKDRGYIVRYAAGRLSLASDGSVVEFYLNQKLRVIGREHLVDGRIRTRRRGFANGGRNFTIDTRYPDQAVRAIETGESPYVLGYTEETETDMTEP